MAQSQDLSSEWSYPIDVEDIGKTPQSYFLSANDEELKNIARRLGIQDLEELSAKLNIERDPSGLRLHVQGNLKAKVIQACVVTGDPVEGWVEEDFEAWYADQDQTVSFVKAKQDRETRKGHQEIEMIEESEDPEPIIGGVLDAGELVTQYLSLAINPYPHAEGAHYDYGDDTDGDRDRDDVPRKSPFEALKNWKQSR